MPLRKKYEELETAGTDSGGGEILKYQGNLFTGTLVEFHDDGTLYSEDEFKNGHMNGAQRAYFTNGQLERERFIQFNRYYGLSRSWDENGNLVRQYDWGPQS